MIRSRARKTFYSGLLAPALLLALAAPGSGFAANPNRDASFMPPSDSDAATDAKTDSGAPTLLTPPPAAADAPHAATMPTGTSAPSGTASAVVAPPPVPAAAPLAAAPVDLGQPVQSSPLTDVNPESIGLIGDAEGGLGASMWKGTPRALVERLMAALTLPTASPTLNNLAARFLLTTAGAPEGEADAKQSLTALRVEKLVALGRATEAWKLALLAKPELIDDATMRLAAEAALASPVAADVCARLANLLKTHTDMEWQKALLVCQLRANDTKGAQLNLDLMRTQNVTDDMLFELAEKNVIGGSKQLPRRLTPVRPLPLALLSQINQPLRDELYAHPTANLIGTLLKTVAQDEKSRLELAERAATRGLIDAPTLATIYAAQSFAPNTPANPSSAGETGARLRALLYQAAPQEKTPKDRAADAIKFVQSLDAAGKNGVAAQVAVGMLGDIRPSADFNDIADQMVRLHIFAGKPETALAWMQVARIAAIGIPHVAAGLQSIWPLTVFAGLESDKDYAKDLAAWLDSALKTTDGGDAHAQRKNAAAILLLLEADGFAVPVEDWARVADAPDFEKRLTPPAFLLEQLRASSSLNRRGEAVLDSLLIAGADNGEGPMQSTLGIVRALRLVGLAADAANLAKETAVGILFPAAEP